MSELMDYLPVLLTAVLGLTLMTNVIVQVLKGLLYDRIPTNLLAFSHCSSGYGEHRLCLWSYYGFPLRGGCRWFNWPVLPGGLCSHVRL